jgi:hypothetical protein
VRGLVAKQIELAMDEKILSQMFIGWSAYVWIPVLVTMISLT